ncbi:MAG: ribosome recycling factor [Candidatus Pacebacteria bacterium CG10_big_fil_rev_8_21_14_0_10_36_11]|nr:ribosome recycling factor [Candidatus Pacearchaeota archaeon]OIP74412.1 MAG: ribosome recycling factor [Candidatus Pacebacteria bacterium CG2_30_36_39]PIR64974.1 MAG: ribosome recycling factor [Candidatus Pacebacteria bacterium CG10_big_fil_rev_8_21_14_0_10_36_11]PJC42509.1 MAG: ribosome recycling factor [Candidatus Pacebacteria bacterium CG_4_9_14_0_2_um_filter_36_8]
MIQKKDYVQQFTQAINHTEKEVSTLRTGRASVQMLDDVMVEAYGSMMHLNEVGNISAPDPTLLVISPWDKSLVGPIEKGVLAANLNLAAIVDGATVKVPVPPLTQERRQEMVKILHQKAESGKVMLRSVRSDVKDMIESQEGEAGVSEDDTKLSLKELEEVTKEYIEKIDLLVKNKEKELLSL